MREWLTLLAEFHQNIKNGSFVPVWAASLQHGYGEPALLFKAPLPLYISEFFFVLTGDAPLAVTLACTALVGVAGAGIFLLLRNISLSHGLASWGASTLGALGYTFSPALLGSARAMTSPNELASLAVLPWFVLSLLRLSKSPSRGATAGAAVATALLFLGHRQIASLSIVIAMITAAFFARKKKLASPIRFAAGGALGLGLSAFYWLTATLESGLVRGALASPEASAASLIFPRLDQTAIHLGALPFVGALLTAWRGDERNELGRVETFALGVFVVLLYFSHEVSSPWRTLIPELLQDLTPRALLAPLCFAGAVFGASCLAQYARRPWQWGSAALLILAFGGIQAFLPGVLLTQTVGSAARGATLPTSVPQAVPGPPAMLIEFTRGRGEAQCDRTAPAQFSCEIMAVTGAKIRVNLLDYPGWTLSIDGKDAPHFKRNPDGTLSFEITPGKHSVFGRLRNSPVRLASKLISLVAALCSLALLFQNKFVKAHALIPKRANRLDR